MAAPFDCDEGTGGIEVIDLHGRVRWKRLTDCYVNQGKVQVKIDATRTRKRTGDSGGKLVAGDRTVGLSRRVRIHVVNGDIILDEPFKLGARSYRRQCPHDQP